MERDYDFEQAAELKYVTLSNLESQIEAVKPLEDERERMSNKQYVLDAIQFNE